ncbi:hypothetical protein [Pedobacter sp. L105]|uniref:hypothetical protein n=1 Tax=Pedobacter sp. L105 TaxID=1641871 RepID=UPI00131DB2E9|nr:hypothetical protein [Pedobacter sp. L105]
MKTPKEFIEEKMAELILSFSHIWCRIEFHQLSDAWYVEINPEECFHEPALKEFLADILFSFNDVYPNESIVFVTGADWFKQGSLITADLLEN